MGRRWLRLGRVLARRLPNLLLRRNRQFLKLTVTIISRRLACQLVFSLLLLLLELLLLLLALSLCFWNVLVWTGIFIWTFFFTFVFALGLIFYDPVLFRRWRWLLFLRVRRAMMALGCSCLGSSLSAPMTLIKISVAAVSVAAIMFARRMRLVMTHRFLTALVVAALVTFLARPMDTRPLSAKIIAIITTSGSSCHLLFLTMTMTMTVSSSSFSSFRILRKRWILVVIVSEITASSLTYVSSTKWDLVLRSTRWGRRVRNALIVMTCPLSLIFSVVFELLLALLNLVLHQIVYPESHWNVVLKHYHDHTVQGETQIVLLNGELLQLLL